MKVKYICLLLLSALAQPAWAGLFDKFTSRLPGNDTIARPIEGGIGEIETGNGSLVDLPYVVPGLALGHWGVGNGGDWLRIGFARARDHAANIVARLPLVAINGLKDAELREWLIKNHQALAADILAAKHIWYAEAKPTCGWTVQPDLGDPIPLANPIQFSYPTCRDKVKSFYEATQLLIHEAVHHFGEGEDLADKVAVAVVDAWREGRIEWVSMSELDSPSPRQKHSAIWTGQKMIVFGGYQAADQRVLADGGIFNPSNNSWEPLELAEAPARYFHDAHWTGDSMIVWGGYEKNDQSSIWKYDGFIWTPKTGEFRKINSPNWSPVSSTWSFDPRQKSVWTGERLIVWGGVDEDGYPLGGSYNPQTHQWTDLARKHPAAPKKMAGHSLTWTGDKLVVWGGYEGANGSNREISNSGAVYCPVSNSWFEIPYSEQTPTARAGHQSIWTGQKLMVFSGGGVSSQRELKSTGGLLDLNTYEWTPVGTEMVIERVGHSATWNGHEAMVYGGKSNRLRTYFGEVYRLDPESNRWVGINSKFTPESRWYHSAVWTGSSLIIWGGNADYGSDLQNGGIYYP